ncbi:MAG: cysteine desulfurase NifS [Elusimicrobia bacterium RIFOXYD2_FULL_34_15]|nr:MAG: cysteine desulfurase NifS [Elusimicrobia bacterium RIFOXYD2_FULL_34_15]
MREVYFENHSNTKLDEQIFAEMLPFLKENYGNAQSMHSLGNKSKDAMENARKQAASLINCKEGEIYFTSCASESNNLAIKGIAKANQLKGKHIIVSSIEHFSVLYSARRLGQNGFDITYLPVDKYGFIYPEDLKKAIREDTILVSIQHANPEIGTIQPIEEISKIVHQRGILFHTDAVCTAGVIPVDVNKSGIDLLTLSGSQFYGPKGAAALYIKDGIKITPQIDGGIQENGRRAGTENVPCIVGFGKACEIIKKEMESNYKKVINLRDRLIQELPKAIDFVYLNGPIEKRLPNNVNFSIEFVEGEGMFLFLDQRGIYLSSGSACTSKSLKMSHVLSAVNIDPALGQGSILMTLSKYNDDQDIDYFLYEFPSIVKKLRNMSPLYSYFEKTGKRHAAGPGTDYEHEEAHHEKEVCE